MLTEVMSPIGLFVILLSLLLVSLIPAAVVKMLMGGLFSISVSYGMVLVGHIISSLLFILALGLTEIVIASDLDQMSNGAHVAWTVSGFLFQALCLKFIAPGPRMVMIALWKWIAVLLLQYVVYFLLALALAFIMS